MASPVIPPRPQRAQAGTAAEPLQTTPTVPARPSRKLDPSPARDMTRSPLNELPTTIHNGAHPFYGTSNLSASDLPRRPPSVAALPSVGQEGDEYASYDRLPAEAHGVKDEQTRHANVPLLAPTASIPSSTAKSRISAVTRTDSSGAAAAGLGRKEDEENALGRVTSRETHPLSKKTSFSRSASNLHSSGTPRPPSVHSVDGFEHGIPVIGQTVPMYPNAGDVQAPSPAPGQTAFPAGVGFFNDGTGRAHQRRRSSRHEFGPPDSYGLHGHAGQLPGDQFERDWIAKHPELAARESYTGYGGLNSRPASALTSEQLNKLVGESDDVGFGTNRSMIGTPDQEVGYIASELYAARRPEAAAGENQQTFHVDPPEIRGSRITGGMPADGAIDLGPNGGNTADLGGIYDERGFGIPIIASDQRSKRPGSAYLQPAVNPEYKDEDDGAGRRGSTGHSRPSSRPGSTHGHHAFGGSLTRFISHEEHQGSGSGTPLEDVEEYEPLFPEEDGKNVAALIKDKLKQRPNLAAHHFPSSDIWEDTPDSLQYTADVDTPEPERVAPAAVFETPEQEAARRAANPHGMNSDAKTFAKPHFRTGQLARPGIQRFPSQDVWEDTPDSMRLETTVSGPQEEEVLSPPEERPTTSALPLRQDDDDARATTGFSQLNKQPSSPARPVSRSKLSQDITSDVIADSERAAEVPDLGSDSTKPVVPARPTKLSGDRGEPPAVKAKPAVPARPAGNKLADLRANFMNDLNSRLQLGPQAPPSRAVEIEPEQVEEKAPLADARKSRAKGPARRSKPAHSGPESFGFSFSSVTLWHIDEEDELKIGEGEKEEPVQAESGYTQEAIGHPGDVPEPTVSAGVVADAKAIESEFAKSLAGAEPAPASAEALHAKDAVNAVHRSGPVASSVGSLDVPAAEAGNVAIRDGEEVGRTD